MCQLVIHSPQTGSRVEGHWMLTAVPGARGCFCEVVVKMTHKVVEVIERNLQRPPQL